jgi:hypothetical protein
MTGRSARNARISSSVISISLRRDGMRAAAYPAPLCLTGSSGIDRLAAAAQLRVVCRKEG